MPIAPAVIEHSLAGECYPQSQAVVLTCGNERLEQPAANRTRNSGPRVLYIDQHDILRLPRAYADLPAVRHRFESVGNQVEEYAFHTRALHRYFQTLGHFVHDLKTLRFRCQ